MKINEKNLCNFACSSPVDYEGIYVISEFKDFFFHCEPTPKFMKKVKCNN